MCRRAIEAVLPCLALSIALCAAPRARAQDEEDDRSAGRRITTTAVLVAEGGAGMAETSLVNIGLRRGVGDVDGVRFVHPADVLSAAEMPEEVVTAVDDLDAIADMVRTGDPEDAARRAEAAIAAFEENLTVVRRAHLVDAYMLRALADCQRRRRRPCVEGFEHVLTFREAAEYDPARYPEEHARLFEQTRERLMAEGARGSIQVNTEPQGAEIFIDGRSYGPSPVVALGLLVGAHYVTVKAVGYEKVIRRASVNDRYEEQVQYELEPSERSLLLEQDLPRVRGELGQPRAGQHIMGLGGYLFTNQVVVGVVRPAIGGQIEVELYLYDLRTRFLLARQRATLPMDAGGMVMAQELAQRLYEGVDLSGAVEAPEQSLVVEQPAPFWQQWWFWTAVGVVIVSGAIAISVLGGDDRGIPEGWTRVGGAFQ